MTRHRKKHKSETIHKDRLRDSVIAGNYNMPDTLDLLCQVFPALRVLLDKNPGQSWDVSLLEGSFVVQQRFLDLSESYARIRSAPMPIPDDIKSAMVLWRAMHTRFLRGHFQHTDTERRALAEVAQWTLYEQAKLRNQDPVTVDLLNEGKVG